MLDTIRAKRNATLVLWAKFVDSANEPVIGLDVTVRVIRQSDGYFLVDGTPITWSETPDDDFLLSTDAELLEVNATNFPGWYILAFAVPDADDTYVVQWDGGAAAANRYQQDMVIADAATTNLIAAGDAYTATQGLAGTNLDVAVSTRSFHGNPIIPSPSGIADAVLQESVDDHKAVANSLAEHMDAIQTVIALLPNGGALTTIGTDTARLTAVRAAILTDWIDGGRLDLILDATLAAAISVAAVAAAARASRAVTDAYCTQSEIESYFGRDNVRKWGDLNNNKVTAEIEARIVEAINRATEEIDARLLGGPYTIPLEFDTMPRPIVKAAVQLAGDDLYTPRGAQDFDEDGQPLHRLRGERRDALKTLQQVRAGVIRLAQETETQATSAPTVLNIQTTRDD